MMTVSTPEAPHDLQLVIDFVNTFDIETARDEIDSSAALTQWLTERQLIVDPGQTPAREETIQLREALRAVLLAHTAAQANPEASTMLERAARRGELSVSFSPDGSTTFEPQAKGPERVLAKLLVPIAYAAADGTWRRVKACRAEDCHWAFYDHSRNRSGRWCEMAVCGNRTKVRAYRSKRAPG